MALIRRSFLTGGAWGGVAVGISNSSSNSEIYGNAFSDPHAIGFFGSPAPINSHHNLFARDSQFWILQNGFADIKTLQQWQAMGYDLDSDKVLLADANFDGKIDGGDYALIDAAFAAQNPVAGYHGGDVNFSGRAPNADEYYLILR